MSDVLYVKKLNNVYVRVMCPDWMAQEVSDHFSFTLPNARFHPKYKNKMWDGTIRLFNTFTKTLYLGLMPSLRRFAEKNGYSIETEDDFGDQEVSEIEVDEFFSKLKHKSLWPSFEIADDQRRAFVAFTRKKRITVLAPTASGKSFLIYLSCWWFKRKTLIVVPRVGLALQMYSDLKSYGMPEEYMHVIADGEEKNSKAPIVISTWQSIYKMPQSYFNQYQMLIGDEVHSFKASSLTSIATKCINADVRIGLTGSLDDTMAHQMVVKGLFGDIERVATTSELQALGRLSKLNIKVIVLEYDQHIRQSIKKNKQLDSYQDEIKFLVENQSRNRFLTNLACSLKGTTLLLFRRTDTHAKVVHEMIREKTDTPVYYIDGSVDAKEREDIRQTVIDSKNSIIVASYGTTSTGVNIPNIDNVIFASPSKSKITVLQSIGRALRLAQGKSHATLFDVADDLSYGSYKNYSILHLKERLQLYVDEQFPFKTYNVSLKKEDV